MSELPTVTIGPPRLPVDPGGTAQVTLQVHNHGSVVDEYTVEVLGDAAAWTVLDRSRVAVFPEGIEAVQATIQPPRESFPQAGDVPVGFRIRSSVDPTVIVVEECHLDLKPFVEIGAEVRPKTAKGRFSASHNLRVINRGNAPVSVSVRAEVQQGDVEVSVPPAPLIVGVGARATTKVKVRPSGSHWSGGDEMHSYRLNVMPKGGAPVAIDAMMRQRPIARIPTALLVVAALFLGGAYVVYGRGPNTLPHWNGTPDVPIVGKAPSPSPTNAPTSGPTNAPTTATPTQVSGVQNQPCTPGAPGNVVATAGNGQATLKWTAPTSTCAVNGYSVSGSPGNTTISTGANPTNVLVPNLTNCTTYNFVVVAVGSGGAGPGTSSNPITPATVPGPPTNVTATAGVTTAALSWRAPANNGCAPITSYIIGPPNTGSVTVILQAAGGQASVTGLVETHSYTFTVAAVNSAGTGPSADSNLVTPCTDVNSLVLTTTPYHVYFQAKGSCSAYAGTLVSRYVSLFGVVTSSTTNFSASGTNPSGEVPWSAPFGTSHTSFTMTLTDSRGQTTTSSITYN